MHTQVFDFTLEPAEMDSVTALNKGWRYIVPTITVSFSANNSDLLKSVHFVTSVMDYKEVF